MSETEPLLPPPQQQMAAIESLGKYIVDMELMPGPSGFFGSSGTDKLVVFLPGWPDTRELFDPWFDAVKAKFAVLSFTVPGMERPPHQPHSEWPHDGFAWPEFLAMLHKFIQEQKEMLPNTQEIYLVGHDFGAVLAHGLDWQYPGCYKKIVAFDVAPVLGKFDNFSNISVSCYQTQFSRYHMGNPCVHCCCYQPVSVKSMLDLGNAPEALKKRTPESWMGSPEFWMYSRMYSHWFASTCGLCSCCCCTPCALGCCKPCNFKFSSEIYDVNSSDTYLKHRAARGHNMFFYSSPLFANDEFISILGSDAIKVEGEHWFFVPQSKGGVATPATVNMVTEKMMEFLSRS